MNALCGQKYTDIWTGAGQDLGPLVPTQASVNAAGFKDNIDNNVLPAVCLQFGEGHFLFKHSQAHKGIVFPI